MLRSAQMLMASALLRHLEFDADHNATSSQPHKQQQVLGWFEDSMGADAVYSIHNLVRCGQRYDMLPGEWYGPSAAAYVLRDLCECHKRLLGGPAVSMVITSDEKVLCIEDILERMTRHPRNRNPEAHRHRLKAPWASALIIIVSLRLGLKTIEKRYISHIVRLLQLHQSLGIIGGPACQAIFFPGLNNVNGKLHLAGLDPHAAQPARDPESFPCKVKLESIRCESAFCMLPDKLEPSLALGFYCHDRNDFIDFYNEIRESPMLHVTASHEVHFNADLSFQKLNTSGQNEWQIM